MERTRYSYWIILGLSIIAMLIGIKFSFERVYDPVITEEQRKQNGFSGKIEEQLISTQSFENTHYIDSAMD